MAGPLSGLAGAQVPFSTTFKPGGSSSSNGSAQTREAPAETRTDESGSKQFQTQAAPVSEAQGSETSNQKDNSSQRGTIYDQLV